MVGFNRVHLALGFAGQFDQLFDGRADFLDLLMGELDGVDDVFFRDLASTRFNHHDSVRRADDHDVDLALFALRVGRVDEEIAFDQTDAHGADWPVEGDIGERERTACAINSEHIRVVLFIGRVDEGNDLGLVAEGLREERADGAIDLPAGQDFLFGGTAFTLDEAARDAASGVREFAVLDREREEVNAFFRIRGGYGRGQDGVVAGSGKRGAGGLLGHASSLKLDLLAAGKLYGYVMLHIGLFSISQWCIGGAAQRREADASRSIPTHATTQLRQRVAVPELSVSRAALGFDLKW